MKMIRSIAALIVGFALPGGPALADNYTVRDGNGAPLILGSKLIGGVNYPTHACAGVNGGSLLLCNMDGSGNLGVNVISSALPAGAATSANQATASGYLSTLATASASQASAANQASQITQETAIVTALSNPLNVNPAAATTGGALTWAALGGTGNPLLTNSAVAADTGPHSLYSVNFQNPNLVDEFCQAFDLAAASVTLGTTVPKIGWRIPAGNGSTAGQYDKDPPMPIAFANAITLACTTTATGSTAPGTGVSANIVYK